jgi:LPS-assembly protein
MTRIIFFVAALLLAASNAGATQAETQAPAPSEQKPAPPAPPPPAQPPEPASQAPQPAPEEPAPSEPPAEDQAPGVDSAGKPIQELPWAVRRSRYDKGTRKGTYLHAIGNVEIEQNDGQRFFADEVQHWSDTGKVIAIGNVVASGPEHRIAADRLEYDSKTGTGTFFNAYGSASLGDRVEKSYFGTQEPDAYFYGVEISKIGPKRYRVRKGGFTSCVQPTPRWELVSTTATIELEEYAVLTNALLKVKGVPAFYLPIMYYPIQDDDRATGFLIPVYGASTVRGQSISNAFFWAINRSQDATILHDWFSKAGQGVGGEYRYVSGPQSQGEVSTYLLDGKEAVYGDFVQPARRSFDVRATATQAMPAGLTAQANVNFFSDIATQQLYQQNVYSASQRSRTISGRLSGSWGVHNTSASYESTDIFYGETNYSRYGAVPRLQYRFSNQQLGSAPVFVTLPIEFAGVLRRDVNTRTETDLDRGLNRIDLSPSVNVPFPKWSFLSVTSTATLHNTRYSERMIDTTGDGRLNEQAEEAVTRRYWQLGTRLVGPVLGKIWDTGNSRFKHVIEPSVDIQRLTSVDEEISAAIPRIEHSHFLITGTTNIRYGIANRLLRKRNDNPTVQARELLSVSLSQTRYSNPAARRTDYQGCPSCFYTAVELNYSPIQLEVTANPTERTSARLRLEYDSILGTLPSLNANGRAQLTRWVNVDAGWSQRSYITNPLASDRFINATTNVQEPTGRYGGRYSFFYDLRRSTLVENRFLAFYNAQCCGIAVEYQTYNYPVLGASLIPQDRRFNISFTLAGIGTFSNFLGAFGGGGTTGSSGYGRGY